MKWLPPKEVARRRIIEEFALSPDGKRWKGKIVCYGRTFEFTLDDVLDLARLAEMIMLKLAGKILKDKFRPTVTDRAALQATRMIGGGYELGPTSEAPLPAVTTCDVTGHDVKTHYLLIEISGNTWESWFGRLDELAKCIYVVVREAQGDKYDPRPAVFVGAKGAIVTDQVGHA